MKCPRCGNAMEPSDVSISTCHGCGLRLHRIGNLTLIFHDASMGAWSPCNRVYGWVYCGEKEAACVTTVHAAITR